MPAGAPVLRALDLFAGCGGMSIGLEEAARRRGIALEVSLAIDADDDVLRVYQANMPEAATLAVDVAAVFEGRPGDRLAAGERNLADAVGECDVLLGGPPCQGHSDLNNHTRRKDPKNGLYLSMARAAEVLRPKVVVIENVVAVQWDKGGVVTRTKKALEELGYVVAGRVIDLRRVGVPQRRRRYLLIASNVSDVDPLGILDDISTGMTGHPDRTVQWAIADLEHLVGTSTYDTASAPSPDNLKRISYLFRKGVHDLPNPQRPECHRDRDHSYKSMYGRLWWDRPAQTITTGFGSMGQGRYVHPSQPRTITPHEAARLQTFPDWFDFGEQTRRGVLAKVIGNAVPPLLMADLGAPMVSALAALQQPRRHASA